MKAGRWWLAAALVALGVALLLVVLWLSLAGVAS